MLGAQWEKFGNLSTPGEKISELNALWEKIDNLGATRGKNW